MNALNNNLTLFLAQNKQKLCNQVPDGCDRCGQEPAQLVPQCIALFRRTRYITQWWQYHLPEVLPLRTTAAGTLVQHCQDWRQILVLILSALK